MKEMYIQSLRMIKNLNVKNKKEYIKVHNFSYIISLFANKNALESILTISNLKCSNTSTYRQYIQQVE